MTFMDHVSELRGRLFWVALWFIVTSGAVFPFFDTIIKLLMHPLGDEKLYYLTPIGGLGFIIKVSMYLGMIATLPVFVYHIYRFISPVVRKHSARRGILYIGISFIMALIGIVFAYTISLPSAIHFLTHVNIAGISPMLTVDSYLSFIIAYLLSGALLFQLPLVMVITDSIKPMPPSQWLKYERHMVVAAFIVGMLVTPTPNVIDQIIMAVPIVVMYQIGIGIIYFRHRSKRKREQHISVPASAPVQPTLEEVPTAPSPPTPPLDIPVVLATKRTMDAVMPLSAVQRKGSPRARTNALSLNIPEPRQAPVIMARPMTNRSIDGVISFR